MMKRNRKGLFLLVVVPMLLNQAMAQDSVQVLSSQQVLEIVRKWHPVVKQADIGIELSDAQVLRSKAAFDPVLRNYSGKKTLNNENYYNYSNPEIVLPTWFGIELVAGLENLSGTRFDVSETQGNTSYMGATIPLAKNLFFDKRRAFLQQAKVFQSMAAQEKQVLVNDILFSAMEVYWQWVNAYELLNLIKQNLEISNKRLQFVRKAVGNGEYAAIDTVEARTQYLNFQSLEQKMILEFQNSGLQLSTYLWTPNVTNVLLAENVVPQKKWENELEIAQFSVDLNDLLSTQLVSHPELKLYNNKLDVLAIDKRAKFQELLPKIDFTYNQLGKNYNLLKTVSTGPLFQNNFAYGFKLEMPLRLSEGRANYAGAKLKITETTLDRDLKNNTLQMKLRAYYNDLENLKAQIAIQSENVKMYDRLVLAENTKFGNGESNLFVINSRENKALEAATKLIELKTKYYKTVYALQWATGILR